MASNQSTIVAIARLEERLNSLEEKLDTMVAQASQAVQASQATLAAQASLASLASQTAQTSLQALTETTQRIEDKMEHGCAFGRGVKECVDRHEKWFADVEKQVKEHSSRLAYIQGSWLVALVLFQGAFAVILAVILTKWIK